jgi:hypothetical protein
VEPKAKNTFRKNNLSIFWNIVKPTVLVDKVEMLCLCKHTQTHVIFTKISTSTRNISLLSITVFRNCETHQMSLIQKKN